MEEMKKTSYLFKMSVPIFVELLLQLLVGNIDQIMVSRYSQGSVAAIVNGNQIMNIAIITLNMMSMATTVILTQCLGAGERERSHQICMLSTLTIAAISLIAAGIAVFGNEPIFRAMNIDADIFNETRLYLIIVGGFTLIQGLYLNFAAILRSFTFLKEVMMVSVLMNVLNIFGNAVLINGLFGMPRLGVVGAAISTVISKCIGLAVIYMVFKKKTDIELKLRYIRRDNKQLLSKLLKIGLPSGAENFSYNMSQICILGIINTYGAMVTATKGYCSILANFAYVYAIAISEAAQIVIGYLLGSGQLKAVEKKVWSVQKISAVVCVGMMALIWANSFWILRMFTDEPEILALGHQILMLDIVLELGRAVNILMTKALITVGEIKIPIVVGITGHWAIAMLLSYILGGVLHLGLQGIWIAMAVDECVRGFIYVIVFKRGKWKKIYAPKEAAV